MPSRSSLCRQSGRTVTLYLHVHSIPPTRMIDMNIDQSVHDAVRYDYTPDNIEKAAIRHGASKGGKPSEPYCFMTMFNIMLEAEGIHQLEGGIIRMKYRRDR